MSEYVELLTFEGEIEEKDILKKALEYCADKLENNRQEIVEQNYIFLPGLCEMMETYEKNGEVGCFDMSRADKFALERLFSFKFIYWKHLRLLAVVGNQHDKTLLKLSPIIFQNNSDQDAAYESWDGIILDTPRRSHLKELREKIIAGELDDKIIKKYTEIHGEEFCPSDIDYYRKTYLYDQIESELCIHSWLYGSIDEFDGNIISFSLSDFRVRDKLIYIIRDAIICINKYCAEMIPSRKEKANETDNTSKKEA